MKKRDSKLALKQNESKASSTRGKKQPQRTRKSQHQKDILLNIYKQNDGETPEKEQIQKLAKQLGLSENQIYKWFWDTKKKLDEDEKKANAAHTEQTATGRDGNGKALTPYQIKQALKINAQNAEREHEFERIATSLGIDIEKIALELISLPSPQRHRQIIK